MIDYTQMLKPDTGQPATLIHLTDPESHDDWLASQPERVRTALAARAYRAKAGDHAILPGDRADEWSVLATVANVSALTSWCLAKLAEVLPEGAYRLVQGSPGKAVHGWMTGQYSFDRYRKDPVVTGPRLLLTPDAADVPGAVRMAQAVALVRDLVNTPTADMGPHELETAVADFAKRTDGKLCMTRGAELEHGYPMIHAVGRAADRHFAPRLIEAEWGDPAHPRVAIIGKGVCFDSGGLDIKPSSAMRLMKKDMGGAAHALALARLVVEERLPVRLHLMIPAVENAISGNAFRPGDVLASRAGISVEIGNTDAEGRLVLGDALTRAGEYTPELIIDFATLTGAARVALGPDLPALFANDDALAQEMTAAGMEADDPVWQLPLWAGYEDMIKSDIADVTNSGEGGFAGAVTAALFLKKFVPEGASWAHFDTFAWRPAAKPGRPKGGEALGLRAAFAVLKQRYGR